METAAVAPPVATPPVEQVAALRLVDLLNSVNSGHEVYFKYVRTALGVMGPPVHKLNLDHKIKDAVRLFTEHKINHAPVIDNEGGGDAMVGIVSGRDVARQLSAGVGTPGEADTDQRNLDSALSSIMTRKPTTVSPETNLFDVVGMMLSLKIDCLPVMGPGSSILGLVTATDISRVMLHIDQLQKMADNPEKRRARLIDFESGPRGTDSKMIVSTHLTSVGDVMSEQPIVLAPEAPLADAIAMMKKNRFRHIPVIDGRKIVGLLSDIDVLHALPPASERGPERGEGGVPGFRDRLFAIDAGHACLKSPIKHTMIPVSKLTLVKRGDRITDTLRMMLAGQLTGVLVVEDPQKPQLDGIVTMTDFLRAVRVLCQVLKVRSE